MRAPEYLGSAIWRTVLNFGSDALVQSANLGQLIDPGLCWEDVERIRNRWKHKLVIKGILHVDDARKAVSVGADSIVVSNHGGRELDGAPSTISVLPEIVAASGGRLDVLMDGGIRRGTHVAKALALGAKGILLGRAYAYGLAAAGQQGVARVIDMLATELDITMALMGVCRVGDLFERRHDILRRRDHD